MEDQVHGGNEPFEEGLIQDRVVDEMEGAMSQEMPEIVNPPGNQIVNDQDLVPPFDQGVNQVGPDISGTAGHQDTHPRPPPLSSMENRQLTTDSRRSP
jgi:hypothetical protein